MLLPLSLSYLVLICYDAVSCISLICMSPTVKIDFFLFYETLCTYLYMRTFFLLYSQYHKLTFTTNLLSS